MTKLLQLDTDVKADVIDFVRAMFRKEAGSAYRLRDYLGLQQRTHCTFKSWQQPQLCHGFNSTPLGSKRKRQDTWEMSAQGRWQIGQWFYKMVEDFDFPEEFAMVAMSYFDRFLSRNNQTLETKREVQLLALTCFYLAVKMYQAGPILSTQQMSMISGGNYTAQEVADMEQRLLTTLEWSLYPPCAAEFVRPFVAILLQNGSLPTDLCLYEVMDEALGMLNAALLLDYFFVAHELPPSHLAIAALLTAMHSIHPYCDTIPSVSDVVMILAKETGTWMNAEQVGLCCSRLWNIHDNETQQSRSWGTSTPMTCSSGGTSDTYPYEGRATPCSPVGVVTSLQTKSPLELYVPSLSAGSAYASF